MQFILEESNIPWLTCLWVKEKLIKRYIVTFKQDLLF